MAPSHPFAELYCLPNLSSSPQLAPSKCFFFSVESPEAELARLSLAGKLLFSVCEGGANPRRASEYFQNHTPGETVWPA